MNHELLLKLLSAWSPKVENCGFVMDDYNLRSIRNVSRYPRSMFTMSIEDVQDMIDNDRRHCKGVYHTHPDNTLTPSKHDVEGWPKKPGLRYFIVTENTVAEWKKDDYGNPQLVREAKLDNGVHITSERVRRVGARSA